MSQTKNSKFLLGTKSKYVTNFNSPNRKQNFLPEISGRRQEADKPFGVLKSSHS
jgi:hypothetical protein